jgi:radical SAM-linked protein
VPLVDELMSELSPEKVAVSLPSLRPGGVSEEVVDSILKVRKTGLTIVPEAGTERLRRVINKHLTDEDIWEASQEAFSRGWRLLKLYFMVGLPTETEEDLQGIVRIVEEILKIGVRYLRVPPQINLSISSFIPKPHTPFQWVAMDSPELLEKKINFLKSQLRKYRSVRFKDHPVDNSVLEAVFSRGDRRLAPVILRAWERGARFDSWSDTFDFSLWEEAFNQIGIDYREYLEAIPTEAHLPWEHLRTGLKRMALLRELRRAYQAEWTPSCLERECRFCLGCDFPGEVNKILQAEREIKSQKEPAREREKSGGGRKGSAEEVSFNQRATTAARDGSLKQQEKEQEKGKESSKRYRFFFTKSGPARFISHLDLINTIQRLLRRARVPAEFSKGFHPKMKLTFLPALPLGMGSQEEVFELRTWSRLDEKNILSRLNSVSPEGISFKRLEEVSQQQPSLNREIKAVLYSLDIETLLDHLRRREGKKKEGRPAKKELDAAQIGELIAQKLDKYTKEVIVAPEEKKIYLLYLVKEGELGNPYRLLQELFNWEEAVFSLVREKVFFKENWREVWLKNQ